MFGKYTPQGRALLGGLLLLLASCGSDGETAENADATEPVEAIEVETSTAAPETTTAPDTTDVAVPAEPNFALTGELDLTTAEINDMVAFVEQSAGREFVTPPIIEIVSIADFEAGLAPDPELQAQVDAESETTARLMQALGHTTLGVDELAAEFADLGSSTDLISGRYDPETGAVLIPDGVLEGDDFNAILVHELLHALDDQYVDLGALIDRMGELAVEEVSSDTAFQIAAVVEGRASTTQFEWMQANGVIPTQQDVPESFERVPALSINQVILPYQLGAQTIFQLGGVAETWDLYDNFPVSSEQMVFPNRIGTDAPVAVEPPVTNGEVFAEGVLGVEGILLLGLGNNLEPTQLEVITIITAAEGWGGDYYVLTGDETESCLSVSIVADTEADLGELESLFTEWTVRETIHTAERSAAIEGDTLSISSCAPFIS